jgi:hypothetical protein
MRLPGKRTASVLGETSAFPARIGFRVRRFDERAHHPRLRSVALHVDRNRDNDFGRREAYGVKSCPWRGT